MDAYFTYVKQLKTDGYSSDQIKALLQGVGLRQDVINTLVASIDPVTVAQQQSPNITASTPSLLETYINFAKGIVEFGGTWADVDKELTAKGVNAQNLGYIKEAAIKRLPEVQAATAAPEESANDVPAEEAESTEPKPEAAPSAAMPGDTPDDIMHQLELEQKVEEATDQPKVAPLDLQALEDTDDAAVNPAPLEPLPPLETTDQTGSLPTTEATTIKPKATGFKQNMMAEIAVTRATEQEFEANALSAPPPKRARAGKGSRNEKHGMSSLFSLHHHTSRHRFLDE